MNEPNEPGAENPGAETYQLPEIHFTPDGQHAVEPSDDGAPPAPPREPIAEAPVPVEPVLVEPPAEEPSVEEPPAEEPPIERHDPFAWMRGAPWMNRGLSPSGRAAILLRRDLEAFPVIEGRDPNHADLDAIVKRTVDYIVPIIKREQATDMVYDELEKHRAARRAAATAAPALSGGSTAGVGSVLTDAMKRLPAIPAPAGVLAPLAAGAVIALKPTTPDDGTFDLGEELRLRTPSGSLQGEIERRVGDRWETLGIRAALNAGLGARVLLDDVAGFANAVGADAAGRLVNRGVVGGRPASAGTGDALRAAVSWKAPADLASLDALGLDSTRLPVAEMRYLASEKGTVRFGDIEKEDVGQYCPNYLTMQEIGLKAGDIVRERGLVRALDYGQQMHIEARNQIRKVTEMLQAKGVREVHAEFALRDGKPIGYIVKGSSQVDVIELLEDGQTICIYDFKTGGARFTQEVMTRYEKEGRMYAAKYGEGAYTNVYVFPIYIPDTFGRDHNRK